MKYLVTGATGTIGSRVAKALIDAGEQVRVGVRDPDKASSLTGAERVRLDYQDRASLTAAFAGVDRVFLLTPFVEEPKPLLQAALDAAKQAGVKHVLRMSAAGADANSDFALARHHGEGEQQVAQSGIAWSVIRPTFFMDNFVKFAGDTIKQDGAFYGAAGDGKTAYISSDDIAASAAAILRDASRHAGKTYSLTGGEAHSESEVASLLSELLGKPVKYVDLEPEVLAAGMKSQGVPAWMVDGLVGLEAVKKNGWAAETSPAVKDLTGRAPQSLRSFLTANKLSFA